MLKNKKIIKIDLMIFCLALVVYSIILSITIINYQILVKENRSTSFLDLVSGDEPHYLALTSAIIYQHSVYLDEHYNAQFGKDSKKDPLMNWPEMYKDPNTWHAVKIDNGHWITIQGPGLSYILVPSYALGGIYGAQFTMVILYSIVSLLIFKFASKITSPKIGIITTIIFSFATISISSSYKIYSDYVQALLALATLYFLFEKRNEPKYAILSGIFLGSGIFFKISFIVVDIVLIPLVIILTLKGKMRWRSFSLLVVTFVLLTLLAGVNNLLVTDSVLGTGYTITAIKALFLDESAGSYTGNAEYRDDSFVEMFVGKWHGIFILSPIVILFILGLGSFWSKNRLLFIVSLCLSISVIGGYLLFFPIAPIIGIGPEFRYYILVLHLMALPFATGLERFSKNWIYRGIFSLLMLLSISLAIGYAMFRTATHSHNFYKEVVLNTVYRGFENIFPSLGDSIKGTSGIGIHHPMTHENMIFLILLTIGLIIGIVISFKKNSPATSSSINYFNSKNH